MKRKQQSALKSKAYRVFINQRNRALERIHMRAQAELNDMLRRVFSRVVEIVAYKYSLLPPESMLTQAGRAQLNQMDAAIDTAMTLTALDMAPVIKRMKVAAYTLSLAGEAEGIALARGKRSKAVVPVGTPQAEAEETYFGEPLDERVAFALSNIRRLIMKAVEQSRVMGETTAECLERVRKALPAYRLVKQPRRPLQRVKEADPRMDAFRFSIGDEGDENAPTLTTGFIDEEAWANVLEWYERDYKPRIKIEGVLVDPRSPTVDRELKNEQFYSWEIEQYTTNEFVKSVRSGQNEAAKQAGVTDFVWIAVLDDKTDDCCAWRDGLSSAEIDAKLEGAHSGDDCRVLVPPAHFNCRCDVAPLLKDMPAVEETNAPEFNEWLKSR